MTTYFAHERNEGTLICRFDDDNSSKEKEKFQYAIVENSVLIGIRPDKPYKRLFRGAIPVLYQDVH